jgi:hypothetical protein
MPRVATTSNINNPKRYGYDVRIDNILLRSAVGPGREMQIQSSDVQEQQINVKQNPEDFTSNLGRIYSRNNFAGGQGLDTAHRANGTPKDTTRFFDSKGVDVFHGDDETSYHTHLLYTMETKGLTFTTSEQYLVQTTNGHLYVSDGLVIYKSTDYGDNWSTVPSTNVLYAIKGMVAFGNNVFVVTGDGGTNKQLIHFDETTWTNESLGTSISGYFTGIWFVKGRLIVTGKSTTAEYLWEADPYTGNFTNVFQTAQAIITVEPTHNISAVIDAGAVILASSTDGNIYSLKDNAGTLESKGQSRIGDEEVHSIEALEGIIFFGTQEVSTNKGRLYRSDLVVADDLYVLANRQLLKEWNNGVAGSPHSMFASRDSIYVGVRESDTDTYLWRYYLPTAGLARDLKVPGQGLVGGIKQVQGKYFVLVEGTTGGVYKETSTYENEGYVIMSAADFYTAEHKQFVGAETSTFTMPSNTSIELYYSTKFEALDNPDDTSFKLAFTQATGVGDEEKQIADIARYIIGKVVLKSENGANTPKVKSVQFRALARPELVVAQIPINISDRVERPGRKPIKVKGLGNTLYNTLRAKEGDSVTLELYDPAEIIRGVVERISYPINSNVERGSVTQYAIITVRGTRQPTVTDVTGVNLFGINALGFIRFGA